MHSNRTDPGEIRRFGVIAFAFFGALCALGIWRGSRWAVLVFGLLALLGLGFVAIPTALAGVYAIWLRVTRAMGIVVTAVFLTLAYYLVITPSAWIKRIVSGAPIAMKPDKTADSYWIPRKEPAQPRDRFLKRY